MRSRRRKPYEARPYWHDETCSDCGKWFEELSDPAASLHLCDACRHKRLGLSDYDAPLIADPDRTAWWDRFVEQYELHKAAGDLDAWSKEKW